MIRSLCSIVHYRSIIHQIPIKSSSSALSQRINGEKKIRQICWRWIQLIKRRQYWHKTYQMDELDVCSKDNDVSPATNTIRATMNRYDQMDEHRPNRTRTDHVGNSMVALNQNVRMAIRHDRGRLEVLIWFLFKFFQNQLHFVFFSFNQQKIYTKNMMKKSAKIKTTTNKQWRMKSIEKFHVTAIWDKEHVIEKCFFNSQKIILFVQMMQTAKEWFVSNEKNTEKKTMKFAN